MRLFSKYTVFVVAPLALASSGCMSGPLGLAGRINRDPMQYQLRLTQAAERYESAGQYQAAYQVYYQIAQQQPGNQLAQQRMQELAQKVNSGAVAEPVPGTDANADRTDQALRMLAEIQAKHRAEQLAKRQRSPRNTDELLASIQTQLDEYKAQQAQVRATLETPEVATTVAISAQTPASRQMIEMDLPTTITVSLEATDTLEVASTAVEASGLPAAVAPAPVEVAALPVESQPIVAPHASANELDDLWWEANNGATELSLADALPSPPIRELSTSVTADDIESLPVVVPAKPKDWKATTVARLCTDVPSDLQDSLTALDSNDVEILVAGLTNLGDQGEQAISVAPAVRALLSHESPAVRAHAAEALFAIEGETTVATRTLYGLLTDSDDSIVQLASYIMGQIGPDAAQAIPHLEVALTAESGITRLHAAEALIRIAPDHKEAFDALNTALEGDDRDLRWFAAVAMGSVKGEYALAAADALQLSLHDDEADVRAAAALSLGGLGTTAEGAINDLEQVALFDEEGVRDAATTALACLKR